MSSDERTGNGRFVSIRNIVAGVTAGTVVAGVILWFQGELKCKADISAVQEIKTAQAEYNKNLGEIRERLVRIETIVKDK
ncbi:MAG: hypothetical protein V1701_02950 [Planctomycetota bacterium]